jgi:hypothetical protein
MPGLCGDFLLRAFSALAAPIRSLRARGLCSARGAKSLSFGVFATAYRQNSVAKT